VNIRDTRILYRFLFVLRKLSLINDSSVNKFNARIFDAMYMRTYLNKGEVDRDIQQ